MHIGLRIKELMTAKGISGKQMAAHCGVTHGAVSSWFATGRISKERLALVAELLHVSTDELISGVYREQGADLVVDTAQIDDQAVSSLTTLFKLAVSGLQTLNPAQKRLAEMALQAWAKDTSDWAGLVEQLKVCGLDMGKVEPPAPPAPKAMPLAPLARTSEPAPPSPRAPEAQPAPSGDLYSPLGTHVAKVFSKLEGHPSFNHFRDEVFEAVDILRAKYGMLHWPDQPSTDAQLFQRLQGGLLAPEQAKTPAPPSPLATAARERKVAPHR